jgi:nucleoside-diphosphate kinase
MVETTFAIIKPDVVSEKKTGRLIDVIERNGFTITSMRKILIDKDEAEKLYSAHQEKPFFDELVTFISSGPAIVMALKKENAIRDWRRLMGDTNPAIAAEGTIRKQFGIDIKSNAVHGSDTRTTAEFELNLFSLI